MIRYFKPKKIIEIGSGNSTYLSTQAVLKNKEENGKTAEFITVEPYPCKIIQEGFPGLTKLIKKEVQDVNLDEFDKLEENDILFIDSSHVLKIGGDVQYEYLKILPRINKGVIIHIHDVFFPVEYPKRWVLQEHRFWTEQYLLISFLMFNKDFEILWAGSYMNLNYSNLLKDAFNSYDKNTSWSSSFWIRRK
ncbi:MAG: class I SAM-dependent methyltransferase [Candidatus Staskawiczbacteria bacterium]|nr:class I SAM-dependent methyltransferase [Candidatus Staskawiczbacteria bacterium]